MVHDSEYESVAWQIRQEWQNILMAIHREEWADVIAKASGIEMLASHANRLKNGDQHENHD